ncbi:RapZ C-terminal domain-containing protein [Faecalibacter rhinopitheci]|uniref:ATP-binding protein n=1 Tax=Faecalibacter rhinopitheci TaxID=2779678 RepID=A0A8J7KDB3_9FLAO|nr:RNase adapter RapZ [Faecalibacter rhinopitheci]MBF0597121.1 ATP-binding protein [Faecalibacter rhinopitheci]MBQ0146938.1 ATP-binding protein [Candidatus Onthonaster equi]
MAKLNINVRSFSYKNGGIPADPTGNGGGFAFDCRGVLNPGRIQEYKTQTGRDEAVKHYLETETKMLDFLNGVYQIIDISIEDYLNRGFENLEINFGCTGGQHRSVYSADATAKHIEEKFPEAQVTIQHVIQEAKNWINEGY